MTFNFDSKSPTGPIEDRWTNHRFSSKLVNPANRRKHSIIIVGTGLAGASAALQASLDGLRATGEDDEEAAKSARELAIVLRAQGDEAGAAAAEASVA